MMLREDKKRIESIARGRRCCLIGVKGSATPRAVACGDGCVAGNRLVGVKEEINHPMSSGSWHVSSQV